MVPSLPSYNNQPSTGNIIGASENYIPSYHIYGIHSQELSPNTVAEVPPFYEPQRYSDEQDEDLQQVEVAPSLITRLIIDYLHSYIFSFFIRAKKNYGLA